MIAAIRPIPWLIPLAISSPTDCVQFREDSDSSIAFIVRNHASHIAQILPNKKMLATHSGLNVGIENFPRRVAIAQVRDPLNFGLK